MSANPGLNFALPGAKVGDGRAFADFHSDLIPGAGNLDIAARLRREEIPPIPGNRIETALLPDFRNRPKIFAPEVGSVFLKRGNAKRLADELELGIDSEIKICRAIGLGIGIG